MIALTGCSDPCSASSLHEISLLKEYLEGEGLEVQIGKSIAKAKEMRSAKEKAEELNAMFRNPAVTHIFDVSGGDLGNTVLPYLDWDAIKTSQAVFYGYSDLTVLINAIIAKAHRPAVNWQIRNLLGSHAEAQRSYFRDVILQNQVSSQDCSVNFVRGESMKGTLIGGNTRCFLKLLGTPFMPDPDDAIQLLEAYGGGEYRIRSMFEQYRQAGIFDRISGILLGTFTELEREGKSAQELILKYLPDTVPVAYTKEIGHRDDAKAVRMGAETAFFWASQME